ncbi:T9SS type A sorting domain-containing protein [Flavobacterium wongokense]|uniref:T9SS type A sorting domain-containing protein n=1 Tax=Flavobacterium wongokense TaxID=2910674 RepID=UPI001F2F01EA|nr:T9SS type A sorting domain-containing protein [Flavobacterium sp. WG47]MCF6131832.1 T9SS type A sorting domain-containing protein [Flavobacterium sp. WG47]
MKKILLLLFSINCFAQAPTLEWQKYFGGSKADEARCIKHTSDGGYIVGAYTFSNDGQVSGLHGTIEDFWVVKLAADGTIQWQKTFGGTGDEEIYSIAQTTDGGYIIAGYATYPNDGDVTGVHSNDYREDFWVIKISSTGNLEWQKALGGSLNEVARDIKQTPDGGYIVIGSTISNNFDVSGLHGTYNDAWVVKLSATGIIEWQKTYGGSNYDYGRSITLSADGGYVFTGGSKSTDGDLLGLQASNTYTNMWVVKISSTGTIQWQRIMQGGSEGYKINTTSSGEYIILGSANHTAPFPSNGNGYNGILKLDAAGTVLWARTYGNNGASVQFGNIMQANDGNYVFSTSVSSATGDVADFNGMGDIWVVKLNAQNGNILWQKSVGRSDAYTYAHYLDQTNDNGYILSGNIVTSTTFPGFHGGGADAFVAKLSADSLSMNEFNPYQLAIYPNPGKDIIKFESPDNAIMDKCIITDLTGKIIITQTERINQIDIGNLSIGMYFIQAFSGANKYQSKFIKE